MDAGTTDTFNRIRPSPTGKSLFKVAIRNMEMYAKEKKGKHFAQTHKKGHVLV